MCSTATPRTWQRQRPVWFDLAGPTRPAAHHSLTGADWGLVLACFLTSINVTDLDKLCQRFRS
jgi:hypothetical protein